MKARPAFLLLLTVTACGGDTTEPGSALSFDRSSLAVKTGDSVAVRILDQAPESVTWQVADTALAVVRADSDAAGAMVRGLSPGFTVLRAAVNSVADSVPLTVLPALFSGTIGAERTTQGSIVVVRPPAYLAFVPAAAAARVNGRGTWLLSASDSVIRFYAPPTPGAATFDFDGLRMGALQLPRLRASSSPRITDTYEPANNAPGGGMTVLAPATLNDTVLAYGSVDQTADVNDFFKLGTPATGGSVAYTIELDWIAEDYRSADLDVYLLDSTGTNYCVLDSCGGATGYVQPETVHVTLPAAGSYRVLVELYDAGGQPTPISYRLRIWR